MYQAGFREDGRQASSSSNGSSTSSATHLRDGLNSIPSRVLVDQIIGRLSLADRVRSRRVCRLWRDLTDGTTAWPRSPPTVFKWECLAKLVSPPPDLPPTPSRSRHCAAANGGLAAAPPALNGDMPCSGGEVLLSKLQQHSLASTYEDAVRNRFDLLGRLCGSVILEVYWIVSREKRDLMLLANILHTEGHLTRKVTSLYILPDEESLEDEDDPDEEPAVGPESIEMIDFRQMPNLTAVECFDSGRSLLEAFSESREERVANPPLGGGNGRPVRFRRLKSLLCGRRGFDGRQMSMLQHFTQLRHLYITYTNASIETVSDVIRQLKCLELLFIGILRYDCPKHGTFFDALPPSVRCLSVACFFDVKKFPVGRVCLNEAVRKQSLEHVYLINLDLTSDEVNEVDQQLTKRDLRVTFVESGKGECRRVHIPGTGKVTIDYVANMLGCYMQHLWHTRTTLGDMCDGVGMDLFRKVGMDNLKC